MSDKRKFCEGDLVRVRQDLRGLLSSTACRVVKAGPGLAGAPLVLVSTIDGEYFHANDGAFVDENEAVFFHRDLQPRDASPIEVRVRELEAELAELKAKVESLRASGDDEEGGYVMLADRHVIECWKVPWASSVSRELNAAIDAHFGRERKEAP
jgi:hypothetical protein